MSGFGLTAEETAFLVANVRPSDKCWEWGSGESTFVLAAMCRYVTTVEHKAEFAWPLIGRLGSTPEARNVSVIYAPPDLPYVEGGDDDGDSSTFRTYVESYTGRGIDVVLIDGRARVECARFVAERAPFGPNPSMRIFCHDVDREQLWPIFKDTLDADGNVVAKAIFQEESRVGRLALLRMRTT